MQQGYYDFYQQFIIVLVIDSGKCSPRGDLIVLLSCPVCDWKVTGQI